MSRLHGFQDSAERCSIFPRFVLKGFSKDGRDLTDKETKAFLAAADKDGDGKIGIDGERRAGVQPGSNKTQTHKDPVFTAGTDPRFKLAPSPKPTLNSSGVNQRPPQNDQSDSEATRVERGNSQRGRGDQKARR